MTRWVGLTEIEPHTELSDIGAQMYRFVSQGQEPPIREPMEALRAASERVGRAWSGSWLGYHALVYYDGLAPPPPGAHFSQEWGLTQTFSGGTVGRWIEFNADDVRAAVLSAASQPDMGAAYALRDEATRTFEEARLESLSILEPRKVNDGFLERIWSQLDKMRLEGRNGIQRALVPSGKVMTRDTTALGQGTRTPPHLAILLDVLTVDEVLARTEELAVLTAQAGRHMSRYRQARGVGTSVFIGHGRSPLWRELKGFIQERLGLHVDEFNRVPTAGVTHVERLSEMLDAAAIALVVMTGEDEQGDGSIHARMNVVHEAGLFQGRLGFNRAIVVLEEGCAEYSNIQGLGQVRFPSGNISASFEEVRRVLEREGVLNRG